MVGRLLARLRSDGNRGFKLRHYRLPVKTRLFVGDGLGIMPYLTTRAAINGSVIDHGTSSTIRWVLDDRRKRGVETTLR
jgi:hypothetical protein